MQCSFPHAVQIKAPDSECQRRVSDQRLTIEPRTIQHLLCLGLTNSPAEGATFCDNENWEQSNLVRPPLSLMLRPKSGGGSFRAKCGHGNCAEESPQVGMNPSWLEEVKTDDSHKFPRESHQVSTYSTSVFPSPRWSSTLTKDESHDDSLGNS